MVGSDSVDTMVPTYLLVLRWMWKGAKQPPWGGLRGKPSGPGARDTRIPLGLRPQLCL